MKAVVIDTNVLVVANERSRQADADCVLACLDALDKARKGIVVLDDMSRILGEYMGRLSLSGQPGVGDAFFKWIFDRQADPHHCDRVHISPIPGEEDNYEEFPKDAALARFDRSDRKFVAVARASHRSPRILNAVDRDWWEARVVLKKHGVVVKFLCPNAMETRKGAT